MGLFKGKKNKEDKYKKIETVPIINESISISPQPISQPISPQLLPTNNLELPNLESVEIIKEEIKEIKNEINHEEGLLKLDKRLISLEQNIKLITDYLFKLKNYIDNKYK